MRVKMEHSLACPGIRIQNRTIPAIRDPFRARHLRGHQQDPPERRGILCVRKGVHVLSRHDQHVHRRLRTDVPERDAMLIFGDDLRRDLLPNDFAE
jgi:hypothetical protein